MSASASQQLRARINRMVEHELARCRAALGPDAWSAHAGWVTENVLASAKQWLAQQAQQGRL